MGTTICPTVESVSVLDCSLTAVFVSSLTSSIDWFSGGLSSASLVVASKLLSSDLSEADFVDFFEILIELFVSASELFETFLMSFSTVDPVSCSLFLTDPYFSS